MWEEERVRSEFKVSHISILYKNKDDRSNCDSYRGISLLSIPGKELARILLNLLIPILEQILNHKDILYY